MLTWTEGTLSFFVFVLSLVVVVSSLFMYGWVWILL